MDGHQVPQQMVIEVGETFKRILKEVKQRATTSSPFFFFTPSKPLFHVSGWNFRFSCVFCSMAFHQVLGSFCAPLDRESKR
jgi:hypothetical protein